MAEKKVIKRIGILSYAKISCILSAVLGLIVGIFYAIIGVFIGATAVTGAAGEPSAGLVAGLGIAAIIVTPIIYGIMGFISGVIIAWLYNLVAKWVGGVELDLE